MRKLWRFASVIIGATTLAAGLAFTASQAGATTQSTARITQSQHQLAPAACTTNRHYKKGVLTFTPCTGSPTTRNCSIGEYGEIFGPLYAANGCPTQVYLWLGHTITGTPDLCVSPQTSTNVLARYYGEFQVTSRTGKC